MSQHDVEFPGQYGSPTKVRTCVKDRFGNWSIEGRPMPEPKQVGERLVCGPVSLKDLTFTSDASGNVKARLREVERTPVTYTIEWEERDYQTDQQPINTNNVAIVARCELGAGCRCVKGDEPGCWNWVSRVEL